MRHKPRQQKGRHQQRNRGNRQQRGPSNYRSSYEGRERTRPDQTRSEATQQGEKGQVSSQVSNQEVKPTSPPPAAKPMPPVVIQETNVPITKPQQVAESPVDKSADKPLEQPSTGETKTNEPRKPRKHFHHRRNRHRHTRQDQMEQQKRSLEGEDIYSSTNKNKDEDST